MDHATRLGDGCDALKTMHAMFPLQQVVMGNLCCQGVQARTAICITTSSCLPECIPHVC